MPANGVIAFYKPFSLRREPSREAAGEGSLVVAVKVAPVVHTQRVAVAPVEPNPVLHTKVRPDPTLNTTIDNVSDHAVPRHPSRRDVRRRRFPLPRDDGMGRRLVVPWCHPEPQRCLERHNRICGHQIRVVQQVQFDRRGLARWSVVVVEGFA